MTREQKQKAISMLFAAETANEHASLAVLACGLETPDRWWAQHDSPAHVVLEQQAHRAEAIREWLEGVEEGL